MFNKSHHDALDFVVDHCVVSSDASQSRLSVGGLAPRHQCVGHQRSPLRPSDAACLPSY
jgi:hypothetical protein